MKKTAFIIILSCLSFLGVAQYHILDSLILYYPFDGNANDWSGNNFHGTISGASLTTDESGNANHAYYFDGVNDYIDLPNDPKLHPDFPFTIGAWIKWEDNSPNLRFNILGTEHTTTNTYNGAWLIKNSDNTFCACIGNGGGIGSTSRKAKCSNQTLQENVWYFVLGVYEGVNDIKVYINCVEDTGFYTGTASSYYKNTSLHGSIGRHYSGNPATMWAKGTIDEIAMWNRALDSAEISELCERTIWQMKEDFTTDTVFADSSCGDYISPSGKIWSTTNTYYDTINNCRGWDSLICINLTVFPNTTAFLQKDTCESYTSPSGNHVWTSSGIYYDTLLNSYNCDSVITVDLTINYNQTVNISESSCENYISPSGKLFTSSGVYNDTIPTTAGCDSIMTIILSIHQHSSSSIAVNACDSYTAPSGQIFSSSGVYNDTISNINGCDSIITIVLDIKPNSFASIYDTVCFAFTSPSGNYTWTSSGTYYDTIGNAIGCDSIIDFNLIIHTIDTSVINLGNSLASSQNNAQYRWLECENMMAISGATNQFFTPTQGGSYAVEITLNDCIDTSACHTISFAHLQEKENTKFEVFPVPVENKAIVIFNNPQKEKHFLIIKNSLGQIVQEYPDITGESCIIHRNNLSAGLYLLELYQYHSTKKITKKILIQ